MPSDECTRVLKRHGRAENPRPAYIYSCYRPSLNDNATIRTMYVFAFGIYERLHECWALYLTMANFVNKIWPNGSSNTSETFTMCQCKACVQNACQHSHKYRATYWRPHPERVSSIDFSSIRRQCEFKKFQNWRCQLYYYQAHIEFSGRCRSQIRKLSARERSLQLSRNNHWWFHRLTKFL